MLLTSTGERIMVFRKRQGLSQKKLAEKLGISVTKIRSYEHDKTEPDDATMKRLAAVFGMSDTELTDGF